jgi:hypothetical protein
VFPISPLGGFTRVMAGPRTEPALMKPIVTRRWRYRRRLTDAHEPTLCRYFDRKSLGIYRFVGVVVRVGRRRENYIQGEPTHR